MNSNTISNGTGPATVPGRTTNMLTAQKNYLLTKWVDANKASIFLSHDDEKAARDAEAALGFHVTANNIVSARTIVGISFKGKGRAKYSDRARTLAKHLAALYAELGKVVPEELNAIIEKNGATREGGAR